jgi:hypothetical protein
LEFGEEVEVFDGFVVDGFDEGDAAEEVGYVFDFFRFDSF